MWTRETRGRVAEIARKTKRYPSDLTDEEWAQLEPLMPKPARRGRKPSVDLREMRTRPARLTVTHIFGIHPARAAG